MGDQLNELDTQSATGEERPHLPLTSLTMTPLPVPVPGSTDAEPADEISDPITTDARTVYNYHRMNLPLFPPSPSTTFSFPETSPVNVKESTAIFTLCSLDIRVAHHAASLFLSSSTTNSVYTYSHLIFSGKVGTLTANHHHFLDGRPEAQVFADIASSEPYNIPPDKIIIEPKATNTGENVRFTHNLLTQRGLLDSSGPEKIKITKFVLVQKPYMERRTFATFVKQWPGGCPQTEGQKEDKPGENGHVEFTVTSPPLSWDDYPNADNPRDLVISIMVGDLVRIKEYPAKGYQIAQHIPDKVWDAGQRLIKAGYGNHLP